MLLKIAPDLEADEMQAIAECCLNSAVDGVIISNTTLSRPALQSPHAKETGGLSGAPLFELSTRQLARFYLLTKGKIPLVGVGGISNAEQAWRKICAGASLLQLYSALVFQGPGTGAGNPLRPVPETGGEKLCDAERCRRKLSRRNCSPQPARQITGENFR